PHRSPLILRLLNQLSGLFRRPRCQGLARWTPPRKRSRVEALEDRGVPGGYSFTTTADAGPGSLRQAILDANATAGVLDSNTFAIATTDPGANATTGTFTIKPTCWSCCRGTRRSSCARSSY